MKAVELVMLYVSCLTMVVCDGMIINELVDSLIVNVRQAVSQTSSNSIPIQNLYQEWHYRWHFIHVKGELSCTEGVFSDLMTMQRTGDAVMEANGKKFSISFALGLSNLSVMYKCHVKAKHLLQFTQHIKVRVKKNSVRGKVSFVKEGDSCKIYLDQLGVEYLRDISVHSGGGPFHKIEDRFLKSMVNHLHDKDVKKASERIQEIAKQHVSEKDFCKKLPI